MTKALLPTRVVSIRMRDRANIAAAIYLPCKTDIQPIGQACKARNSW
jgi:hypothetical protein